MLTALLVKQVFSVSTLDKRTEVEDGNMELVVGADVGGTSSKTVVLTKDFRVAGFAKAPGGNVNSSTGDPLGNVFAAIDSALAGRNGDVVAGHLGIAGAGPARILSVRAQCVQKWAALGMEPENLGVTSDLEVAYAAGARGGDGLLLLSGTGAVAAMFRNFVIVDRCDGMGWLLGDIGSATWLGLEVLKAVAAGLDGRGPRTSMTADALAAAAREAGLDPRDLAGISDPRQQLIASAYRLRPAQYGSLSIVAEDHAALGDPVASDIMDRACRGLAQASFIALAGAPEDEGRQEALSMVFAGALLASGGPFNAPVRQLLQAELPWLRPDTIGDNVPPIVGSLRLAALAAGWETTPEIIFGALSQAGVSF